VPQRRSRLKVKDVGWTIRNVTVTFGDAWGRIDTIYDGCPVSPQLAGLLRRIYVELASGRTSLSALKSGLILLLEFLSGEGRTHGNCHAVDRFFRASEGWEIDWVDVDLPDDFHDLLADLGGALHDTIAAPDIASNFDSLPEQLLARAKSLRVS
jgi:hypothetical protein